MNLRLRTKFLLSLLVVSFAVTGVTLWMVGRSVRLELRKEIAEDLDSSVVVFRDFQRQREIALASSAELLANLPSLKALMTTRDAATIQDASTDIWRLAPSDVFLLADPTGRVMSLHTEAPGITRSAAEELLKQSETSDEPSFWWYGGGRLYQVFLKPIYFGSPKNGSVLGILGVGHEISNMLAGEVGRVATSQVAFFYGPNLIASSVNLAQERELASESMEASGTHVPAEIRIGGETFLATTVELAPITRPAVRLTVLKSYDKAAAFLDDLNRLLLAVGALAVLALSAVVFVISHTFTKPLTDLVAGVRALEKGDFAYPLPPPGGGSDETAELNGAFEGMRLTLKQTQQDLLASERLATIGRTASSISHDLRHPLTAVVANAEFLCEPDLDVNQREELYSEIRTAVDQMTDLIESLLEFSRPRESLRRVFAPLQQTAERARDVIQANPEFQGVRISISCEGRCEAWFDEKKVERALINLLLNACQSVSADSGQVAVNLRETGDCVEIRIADNGPGVPDPIREKIFQPFVSYGKQNGTGLGLTIGQKIFEDHGGEACLESSEPGETVFKLTLPMGEESQCAL